VAATLPAEPYITFLRTGTSWSQQGKRTSSATAVGDFVGVSVAIDGGTIVVGASMADNEFAIPSSTGAVYV